MDTVVYTTIAAKDIPDFVADLITAGATEIKQIVYCSGYKAFLILYVV